MSFRASSRRSLDGRIPLFPATTIRVRAGQGEVHAPTNTGTIWRHNCIEHGGRIAKISSVHKPFYYSARDKLLKSTICPKAIWKERRKFCLWVFGKPWDKSSVDDLRVGCYKFDSNVRAKAVAHNMRPSIVGVLADQSIGQSPRVSVLDVVEVGSRDDVSGVLPKRHF